MRLRTLRAGCQGDSPEPLVVQFQRVASLPCPPKPSGEGRVDLPVGQVGSRRQLAKESLDFGATQVSSLPVRILREEPSNPTHAERDRLFLSASISQHLDVVCRPSRRRVRRSGRRVSCLRHISEVLMIDMPQTNYRKHLKASRFLRHIRLSGPDMFEA